MALKGYSKKQKRAEQTSPTPPATEKKQTVADGPVRMFRSEADAQGGPTSADVHPSEVEAWKAAGWQTK